MAFDKLAPPIGLTDVELRRYGRHLVIPEVGAEGQERLKAARVLVVGAGGLGSPLALYLAAAGVGRLGLVDFDRVEESNLQRQVLFGQADIGRPKLEAAAERLREVNPLVELELHGARLAAGNALELVGRYDIVADGSDNFPTRYLVNDACVLSGKPDVWGAVYRFEGQVAVFWGERGPCYRCLFPEPPPPGAVPSCAEAGVLGVLPGIIGSLQANEVLKLILGVGTPLLGRLLLFDALAPRFREVTLPKNPDCPVCSAAPRQVGLVDHAAGCPEPDRRSTSDLDPEELERRLKSGWDPVLVDVRTVAEYRICHLEASKLIPLAELEKRLEELDRERETVVYCHHGVRSLRAAALLRERGFARVLNLRGGIDAWSRSVDPSVPRY